MASGPIKFKAEGTEDSVAAAQLTLPVAIEARWARGDPQRGVELAKELVQLGLSAIVTQGPAIRALRPVAGSVPVVFAKTRCNRASGRRTSSIKAKPNAGHDPAGRYLACHCLTRRLRNHRSLRP